MSALAMLEPAVGQAPWALDVVARDGQTILVREAPGYFVQMGPESFDLDEPEPDLMLSWLSAHPEELAYEWGSTLESVDGDLLIYSCRLDS